MSKGSSKILEFSIPEKKCGLCGSTKKLMKTECCGNWICDDYDKYVTFSYARNSCARNHDRYTMCAAHHHEGHKGKDWRECDDCRDYCETEMYVYYATNEYNFVKLEKVPKFESTCCGDCNRVIDLASETHVRANGSYFCTDCRDIS